MKTELFAIKNGILSHAGEHENTYRNPSIILFCFDEKLSEKEVLNILFLEDAEVHISATYSYTLTELSDIPDYYKYEIFLK